MADEKPFQNYARGDKLPDGAKITDIFAATATYLILRTDDGRILFKTKDGVPSEMRDAEGKFLELLSEGRQTLQGAYEWQYMRILGHCLAIAMQGSAEKIDSAFKQARDFLEKRGPIKQVFGSGPGFLVFLSNEGKIEWQGNVNDRIAALSSEVSSLYQIGRVRLCKEDQSALVQLLGSELVAGFRAQQSTADAASFFRASRDFVERCVEAIFRSRYIMASIEAFLLLSAFIIIYLIVYGGSLDSSSGLDPSRLLGGGFAGMVGALVSVIQRGNSLTLSPFYSVPHVVFQGILRMFLGLLFGALAVIAVDAQILLGLLKGNISSLALLCVAAGFSERLIPDLLEQISEQSSKKTKEGLASKAPGEKDALPLAKKPEPSRTRSKTRSKSKLTSGL